jgi:hypothetical protein
MAFTVTSSSRQIVMATLIALATCGGLVRYFAPNPSTLRDVGSLLLVLWLPAVGNVIGFFIRKIPRRVPPATRFAPGAAFASHLRVELDVVGLPPELAASLDASERQCTVLVRRRGFTARMADPVLTTFAAAGKLTLELQLLHPQVALKHLAPGTALHVLVGRSGVARGVVLAQ